MNNKNIVFIPNIKLDDRSSGYEFSIKSWKVWCDKNDVELFVLEELLVPVEDMRITWQRYYLFDILEANGITYNQILMVDSDTIIHPDCPNFFNDTDGKYCGVINDGSTEWTLRGIENYSKFIFNDVKLNYWECINGGFQIVNKTHQDFFNKVIEFYNKNKTNLIEVQNFSKTGSDQIPLNFLLKMNNIDIKYFSYKYNMMEMYIKEIVTSDLLFTKLGYIYHFNAGLPKVTEEREDLYWMRKTYKNLFGSTV
jgi:hypothetical protein